MSPAEVPRQRHRISLLYSASIASAGSAHSGPVFCPLEIHRLRPGSKSNEVETPCSQQPAFLFPEAPTKKLPVNQMGVSFLEDPAKLQFPFTFPKPPKRGITKDEPFKRSCSRKVPSRLPDADLTCVQAIALTSARPACKRTGLPSH